MPNNIKNLIILRGVSGSGKTTFAKNLLPSDTIICCADDYFIDENGEYYFDASKLSEAHSFCRNKFIHAIKWRCPNIAIANTNAKEEEFAFYVKLAKEECYRVYSIVLENRHCSNDVHGVPENVKARQEEKIKNSLQL